MGNQIFVPAVFSTTDARKELMDSIKCVEIQSRRNTEDKKDDSKIT